MIMKSQCWPLHDEDEIQAVTDVLRSGKTNHWTGNHCREFEKEYAEFVGTSYAIALMNGTVALEAALYALEIGPGDEVITSCRTFIASASCIVMRGAIPVLADIDMTSQNITAATIEPCITPRTKAIIVVHLAGWPADMESIMALAHQYQLKVIEDCAQAHGATINNKQVGSFGDIGAFSFCQDKIITTGGEGGMITTHNKTLWERIWALKDHGKSYDKVYHHIHPLGFRWLHDSFGTNWRMTEMQAAIGRIQLKKLSHWLEIRNKHAALLNQYFANIPALRLTLPPPHLGHAYYKYYVFVEPKMLQTGWSRDRILEAVNALGISCFSGICSDIQLEKAFQNDPNNIPKHKPHAQILGETSLVLLIDPSLTEKDIQRTAETLIKVLEEATLKAPLTLMANSV